MFKIIRKLFTFERFAIISNSVDLQQDINLNLKKQNLEFKEFAEN